MSDSAKRADATAWLAVCAGTLGSLMATLDTSVVNSSLPTIQGEIGANESEGTWISTAYLVAEIIMIPLAGWFDRILGLRRFLLICTTLFTGFSISCGLSNSLGEMIIGRIGQGFTGGAMVPTALTIVATQLPPSQRPFGIALFGITAVLGPVGGPVIGGWLTENISWRDAFFINVPLGIALLVLLLVGLKSSKANLAGFADGDYVGILGFVLGLGALTTVLEEGQRERWFESELINWLCVVSVTGFILIAIGQWTARQPVIQLKILFTRAFGSVFILSLFVGAALYGINYMLPQFLANFDQYNALQSGEVTLISGIPALGMMFIFPVLVRIIDVRIAVGLGLLLYGVSCLMNTGLTTDSSGVNFVASQLVCGFGQFFSLIFLNQAATSAVSQELAEDASGLFNAARNLGGSIGLAAIATMRERRTDFHTERLAEVVTNNALSAQAYVSHATAVYGVGDHVTGLHRAQMLLYQIYRQSGQVLAFSDLFYVFGIALIAAIPLVLFLKPLPKDAEASVA